LVIGNSVYDTGPLKNPVNDAAAIATMLKKLVFSVTLRQNAKLQEMDESIREFGKRLKKTRGVGLFYYAGHGVQIGGVNYLLPVNARIEKESDVRFQSINADTVLAEMENAENGLNIVILDACRDNPFSRSFRNVTRGLAIISNAPSGTFISYSTGANQVARDGDGENSPYTQALLEYMDKPGLTLNNVFMNVRSKVKKETGQIPWELSSLEGDFYFVPGSESKKTIGTNAPTKTSMMLENLKAENRKLEEEQRRLEEEKALFAKKKALEEKRKKIEIEKEYLKSLQEAERKAAENRKQAKKTQASDTLKNQEVPVVTETRRDERFIGYTNGTVLDTWTNLMWAAKDNGSDINWYDAKKYCESYRGGGYIDWRMPTIDELRALYYKSALRPTKQCERYQSIYLTSLIDLSCGWVWASTANDGVMANFFIYHTGHFGRYYISNTQFFRALPVRVNAK